MAGVYGLIAAVSAELVSSLVTAKLPPLSDGKILAGERGVALPGSPPRVVFIPTGSEFAGVSYGGAIRKADNVTGLSAERRRQHAQHSVATDVQLFNVHVQGNVTAPDGFAQWDATQRYAHLVIRALSQQAHGGYELRGGEWTEPEGPVSQTAQGSREYVLAIALHTPVLAKASEYVPEGTSILVETTLESPDGGTEVAFPEPDLPPEEP